MNYEITKKFMYKGILCVVVKMEFFQLSEMKTVRFVKKNINPNIKISRIYHNGYVESSLKCSYHDLERHIKSVELTYSGHLSQIDHTLKDRWFFGFDTAHHWNQLHPNTQNAKAVERDLKKLCDEIISKGGIKKIYDDNLAEIIAEKL
jgi:hypothetical protein